MIRPSRRRTGGLAASLFTVIASLAGSALAADSVKLGILNSSGDLPFFIAAEKGYFAKADLDVQMILFNSAARMIAPLGIGDLDAGGGTATAGLYNAAARKIDVRLVGSRAHTAPGYRYQTVVVRKDLVDSGRVKTLADIKGLKFGTAADGIGPQAVIDAIAKKAGFRYGDVDQVFMGFPEQIAALRSRAIDATVLIEPYSSTIVDAGDAVHFIATEDVYPGQEVSAISYGEKFIQSRPEVGKRFMTALVRAMRDYNDAMTNGRWNDKPIATEIIGIFARAVNMPEAQIRRMQPQAMDPNGDMNIAALRSDLDFFKAQGFVQAKAIQPEDIIDRRFIEAARQTLGPYVPR